jgi:DNA primase
LNTLLILSFQDNCYHPTPMDAVSEIKARLPIEELAGSYCQLQKKGKQFLALCPFHNDTKPSLTISPDKGIAYCFACNSGGDIFSFYQQIEGVDFVQALKDLAEKTGVDLPKRQAEPSIKKDEKDSIRKCLEKALEFYRSQLKENENAKKYMTERKISTDLIEKFEIGYAPDSFDATYSCLLKAGHSRSEIVKAGLGIQKELQEERIYDRFRNRIIFPIRDHNGHLIGFGGRTIGNDDAKYINSPDGPLYNKSIALFGIYLAKEAIRKSKNVVLVEGYFDVTAFHRIGIENVVAVSGTALTEQHVNILKRYTDKVTLCLDNDTAGKQAAERAYLLCKSRELNVKTLVLPAGKDPDECVTLAPEDLKKSLEDGAMSYFDGVIAQTKLEMKDKKVERKDMLSRIIPLLNAMTSSVEREEAMEKAASLFETTVVALKDDMEKEKQKEITKQKDQIQISTPQFSSTELLLGLILSYSEHIDLAKRLLEPEEEKTKKLYITLKAVADSIENEEIDKNLIEEKIKEQVKKNESEEFANILQLYCEGHFGEWSSNFSRIEIKKILQKVNKETLLKKQKELISGIREARNAGKKIDEERLLTQYQQVLKLSSMN